jgi:DNA adenine methylase
MATSHPNTDLPKTERTRTQKPPLRPPLKWAGGKRWLVSTIRNYWRGHSSRRFVEPFCGGLSITLSLSPRQALLNDANTHLINFYQWLQKGLSITIDARNVEEIYYANRNRFNELVRNNLEQTSEAGQLFYYLNRTCFNGLCRFNQKGAFNVPFGSYSDRLKYVNDFDQYREVLGSWTFTNTDFEQLPLEPTDFVYADPPYDVEFTAYSKGGFSWNDQERTAKWLVKHPGPVILSNQKTKKIEELYKDLGFSLIDCDGPRRISCNGDRKAAKEVLALLNLNDAS